MGKQLCRQRHQCQAGGAWARSSPAAAERGVEDAGLEVGHAAPDHHDRRLPLIASDTVRQFECRFVHLNVWGALNRQPFYVALVDGIVEFMGKETAKSAFDLPFSLNTAAELRMLANDVGLQRISIRFEHRTMRYPAPAKMVAGFMIATPIASQFQALPSDRQSAFVDYVAARLAGYVDDAGLAVPMENHFLTAVKP